MDASKISSSAAFKPEEVVEVARSWIGTPYVYKGRTKGQGVDCWGFTVKVYQELSGSPFDFTRYPRRLSLPTAKRLRRALDVITESRPGDFAAVVHGAPLQGLVVGFIKPGLGVIHTGITAFDALGRLTVIHADDGSGVVENRLIGDFRDTLGTARTYRLAIADHVE